jgi:hypothetical protein
MAAGSAAEPLTPIPALGLPSPVVIGPAPAFPGDAIAAGASRFSWRSARFLTQAPKPPALIAATISAPRDIIETGIPDLLCAVDPAPPGSIRGA